jgi:hypothetical protein
MNPNAKLPSYFTSTIFAILVLAPMAWWLTGCADKGGATSTVNDVYAVAVALTAADNVALQYVTLPLCGPTHPKPVCSEAAVSAQIKVKAQQAHDAVKAAEANTALIDAARAAINDLIKVTPKVGG